MVNAPEGLNKVILKMIKRFDCKWNLVRMLIYNAIVTDKTEFSLQSPILALSRESRVRAPTRLE